jgi:hypothetical protein
MNACRVLYSREYAQRVFRNALAEARSDLHEMHHRHLCELEDLRKEIAELRSIFLDVVTNLRTQAEQDVTQLRRQLETALLRLAQRDRDPAKPLH